MSEARTMAHYVNAEMSRDLLRQWQQLGTQDAGGGQMTKIDDLWANSPLQPHLDRLKEAPKLSWVGEVGIPELLAAKARAYYIEAQVMKQPGGWSRAIERAREDVERLVNGDRATD